MTPQFRLAAASALALLFAACTPPASQQADAPDAPADEAQAGQSFSDGTVRASFNGGAEVVMAASECMIVNDGANGVVRAGEGSFELNWSDTGTRAVWDSGAGLYNGDVHGALQDRTITFQGEANGASIAGSATCD